MYNLKVALAVYHPRDPTTMCEEAGVWPAQPGGAIKAAVISGDYRPQWIGSVLIVSVRVQGAEGVQHGEVTRRGDFEDRPSAILAAVRGHAVNHIAGAARECHARGGSVRILSVRIQRAESMQDCVLMRVPVEPVYHAVAILATDTGHPVNGAVRTQGRQGVWLRTKGAGEGCRGWGFKLIERRECWVIRNRAGHSRCRHQ